MALLSCCSCAAAAAWTLVLLLGLHRHRDGHRGGRAAALSCAWYSVKVHFYVSPCFCNGSVGRGVTYGLHGVVAAPLHHHAHRIVTLVPLDGALILVPACISCISRTVAVNPWWCLSLFVLHSACLLVPMLLCLSVARLRRAVFSASRFRSWNVPGSPHTG